MTSPRNPFRRSGLAAASVLLLGTACGEQSTSAKSSGARPEPAPVAQAGQELGTVRICGKRHEDPDKKTLCMSTTDVGSVYSKILEDHIRNVCVILTPTSWQSCMEWPPVLWPEVTSAENSTVWTEQAQRIVTFYKSAGSTQEVTMKSNQLSLEKIRDVAWQMRDQHGAELEALYKRNQNILNTELSAPLKQRAAAEGKALQAEKAEHRENLTEIQVVIDEHQAKLRTLQPTYDALLLQFAGYRTTEPVILARLQELARLASTATLQTLPNVQLELVQLSRAESLSPQQMALDAKVLAVKMGYEHDTFLSELAPYAAFMRDNGITRPNLADASIQVLENIISYADSRYARTSDIIQKTLEGIRRRQEALAAQSVDAATRKTLADASTLEASQKFLAEMNARVTEVGTLPPRSTKLALYYLAEKLREHEAILQLQPVCANTSSTPWMGTGCNALALQYSKSRTYITSTLPNMIRLNLTRLRTAGVNPTLLQQVEQHLATNSIRAATVSYDVAVRASESL
jgi:hypothetical protein